MSKFLEKPIEFNKGIKRSAVNKERYRRFREAYNKILPLQQENAFKLLDFLVQNVGRSFTISDIKILNDLETHSECSLAITYLERLKLVNKESEGNLRRVSLNPEAFEKFTILIKELITFKIK